MVHILKTGIATTTVNMNPQGVVVMTTDTATDGGMATMTGGIDGLTSMIMITTTITNTANAQDGVGPENPTAIIDEAKTITGDVQEVSEALRPTTRILTTEAVVTEVHRQPNQMATKTNVPSLCSKYHRK
jgi:hypothetical protein